jgi:hypothetical protein
MMKHKIQKNKIIIPAVFCTFFIHVGTGNLQKSIEKSELFAPSVLNGKETILMN